MAQILDPIPNDRKNSILCCYVNVTSNIQVARITNIPNWYFERVVFPGQRLMFEALPEAESPPTSTGHNPTEKSSEIWHDLAHTNGHMNG